MRQNRNCATVEFPIPGRIVAPHNRRTATESFAMATEQKSVLSSKNECGKLRSIDEPYEIWELPDQGWEWRVLKKYQSPKGESTNPYARWHCAVKSPWVDGYERGDTYIHDIRGTGAIQTARLS